MMPPEATRLLVAAQVRLCTPDTAFTCSNPTGAAPCTLTYSPFNANTFSQSTHTNSDSGRLRSMRIFFDSEPLTRFSPSLLLMLARVTVFRSRRAQSPG